MYQKHPDSKTIERELNSGRLENIYLFLGEEEGEKEKIIRLIVSKAIPDEQEKIYSTGRFHAEYGELGSAAEFILTFSMFGSAKICILMNIESVKSKAGEAATLSEMIENLPGLNILIMTSTENKIPAAVDSRLQKKIKTIQFWRPFENDIATYIIKTLKQNNIEIKRDAVNLLIELKGGDMKKTDDALFKIINSGEKSITADTIKYLIPDDKEISVFEFIDSFFQKKKDSFHSLSRVLEEGHHELAVLKLVMRQAELLEKFYYIEKESGTDIALEETGISQRNRNTFLNCSRAFSAEEIAKIFPLIYRTDYRLKSYNYSGNLASNPLFGLMAEVLVGDS